MLNRKKEMLPEEQEDENKKMIGQPQAQPQEEIGDVNGRMADHTHPELDQVLIKIQEIEQRLGDQEMSNSQEDPMMMEKTKSEDLAQAPEKEPDHEAKKKINTENPEQIPQTNQPANGTAPGDDNYQKYDNKAKDVEAKAISATPNASGKIPKNEAIKVKLDIEDDKEGKLDSIEPVGEASPAQQMVPEETPMEKPMEKPEGEFPLKKIGEELDEEDKKIGEQVDPMKPTAGTNEDPTQRKPEDAPAQPNAMKQKIDPALTKRQSVVGAEGSNQTLNLKEREAKSVSEYLSKTRQGYMFKK